MRSIHTTFAWQSIPPVRAGMLPLMLLLTIGIGTSWAQHSGTDLPPSAQPAPPLLPVTHLQARDLTQGAGGQITLTWTKSSDNAVHQILRSTSPDGPYQRVEEEEKGTEQYVDQTVKDGTDYYYVVEVTDGQHTARSEVVGPVRTVGRWFNPKRTNVLVATMLFIGLIIGFIVQSRQGREMYIRPIAGIQAIEEAVGRSTEMGRPILYVPGLSGISDVATLASIAILGRVAERAAEYNTPLLVVNCDPIVLAIAQETVREAHIRAGRPDTYNEDHVFFISDRQFAFAAGVNGLMVRERPATNLFIGMFYAESLLLAETGASIGAIQIAGTDAETQLPFFITACDYTLIGEELYAAGAYISQNPMLLGTLKAQDWSKVLVITCMIVGILFLIAGWKPDFIINIFSAID